MSQNPPQQTNLHSPQELSARLLTLDLEVHNITVFLKANYKLLQQVEAQLLDLQARVSACEAKTAK